MEVICAQSGKNVAMVLAEFGGGLTVFLKYFGCGFWHPPATPTNTFTVE